MILQTGFKRKTLNKITYMQLFLPLLLMALFHSNLVCSQTVIYSFDANGSRIEKKLSSINPNKAMSQQDNDSAMTLLPEVASFVVYPNPTSTFITIEPLDKAKESEFSVTIFDKLGKTVYDQIKILTQYASINISSLTSGIYTLKIISQEKINIFEIVKQ